MKKVVRGIVAVALLLLAALMASRSVITATTVEIPLFKVLAIVTGFGLAAWFAWGAITILRKLNSSRPL